MISIKAKGKREKSLSMYLKEIGKYSPLSQAEEKDLIKRAQAGDKKASEKIITSNLKFVVKIANLYKNRGLLLSDLINEGNTGLIKAIKKFDITRDIRFLSYATWWIKQAILKAISQQTKVVRVPSHKLGDLRKIREVEGNLSQKMGRPPTAKEIADAIGVKELEVLRTYEAVQRDLSLDAPISADKEFTLSDTIETEEVSEESVMEGIFAGEIREYLKKLSPRQAKIVALYIGLDDGRPYTLREIGEKFGISRERVRQIKEKAIQKLRTMVCE
jgi:RNA polymerase primary sigma factor